MGSNVKNLDRIKPLLVPAVLSVVATTKLNNYENDKLKKRE